METGNEPGTRSPGREGSPPGAGVVFVCDASAEAERLMGALRTRGYQAVDVPLGLLPTRVRYEIPDLVVLDAEALEAGRRVAEMREAASAKIRLVLVEPKDSVIPRDPTLREGAALTLTRPLDISRAADALADLLGPPPRNGPRATQQRSPRGPILVASARRPYRTDVAPSSRPANARLEPFESHWPTSAAQSLAPLLSEAPAPIAEQLPRATSYSSAPPADGLPSISPETRALLDQARRRVASHPAQASRPARLGASDVHGTVAPELIAALREVLGSNDLPEDEPSTNAGETAAGGAGFTRSLQVSDLPPPTAPPPPSIGEADRTNPGGRPPSGGPSDRTAPPSALPLTGPPHPPPLEDLSDLLLQPLHPLPILGVSPSDEPPSPVLSKSEIPSTNPGGRSTPSELPAPSPSPAPPERPRRPIEALALCIRERWSGALAQETTGGVRRALLKDGDLLTVISSSEAESLVHFLEHRGDLPREAVARLGAMPKFGRHAGAALIAQGHLRQEDLWPVLRAHSEWLLGRALGSDAPLLQESEIPARLLEEPAVFGGAAGAEIYVDVVRRVVQPDAALARLGGGERTLSLGPRVELLGEIALESRLEHEVHAALGRPLDGAYRKSPELLVVLLALTELDVLSVGTGTRVEPRAELETKSDAIDDGALRARVQARRALVEEGDYFLILGVTRSATRYEVERAREQLHRELDLGRLTARNADLRADVELVLALVDEAHLVLSDDVRRERYRRALEASPP